MLPDGEPFATLLRCGDVEPAGIRTSSFRELRPALYCLPDAMILPQLAVLSLLFAAPAPAAAAADATPQGGGVTAAPNSGPRNPQPSGGTPEPATLLLVAGSALAYGVMRRRRAAVKVVKIDA